MKYEKLVRDLIPQIIEESGDEAVTRVLEHEECYAALKEKLHEEVTEYLESEDVEELADVLEVVRALLEFHTMTYDEVEEMREKKVQERGSFNSKIYLVETIENS